jgi:hypothetical protein
LFRHRCGGHVGRVGNDLRIDDAVDGAHSTASMCQKGGCVRAQPQ